MNERPMIGLLALAVLVVGVVIYRTMWALGREMRRKSGVLWFKPREPK